MSEEQLWCCLITIGGNTHYRGPYTWDEAVHYASSRLNVGIGVKIEPIIKEKIEVDHVD
jgi:hypothetical protein